MWLQFSKVSLQGQSTKGTWQEDEANMTNWLNLYDRLVNHECHGYALTLFRNRCFHCERLAWKNKILFLRNSGAVSEIMTKRVLQQERAVLCHNFLATSLDYRLRTRHCIVGQKHSLWPCTHSMHTMVTYHDSGVNQDVWIPKYPEHAANQILNEEGYGKNRWRLSSLPSQW